MKKIIIIGISVLFIILLTIGILYFNYNLEVIQVKQLNFNTETNELTIEVTKKNNIFNKDFSCLLFNNDINIVEKDITRR